MKITPPPIAHINGTWQRLDVSRYSFKEDVRDQKAREQIRLANLKRFAGAGDSRKPRKR